MYRTDEYKTIVTTVICDSCKSEQVIAEGKNGLGYDKRQQATIQHEFTFQDIDGEIKNYCGVCAKMKQLREIKLIKVIPTKNILADEFGMSKVAFVVNQEYEALLYPDAQIKAYSKLLDKELILSRKDIRIVG